MKPIVIPSRGEIAEQPLSALLLALHEDKKDCALVVQRSSVRKEILFRNGEVVRIISTDPSEALSRFLGLGAASQEIVFRHLQDHSSTFLEAIVSQGLADKKEIAARLEEAAQTRLSNCLFWERGTYEMLPVEKAKESGAQKLLSLPTTIFSLLKNQVDEVKSTAFLRPVLRARLTKTSRFETFLPVFESVFGKDNISKNLTDGLTCEDLLQNTGDPARVFSELYTLLQTGLLSAEYLGDLPLWTPLPGESTRFFPGDPAGYTKRSEKENQKKALLELAEKSRTEPENQKYRADVLSGIRSALPENALHIAEIVTSAWTSLENTQNELADLHYEIGRSFEEVASRLDTASERYRMALAHSPSHRLAQDALQNILRAAGDDEGRALLLAKSIQAEPDLTRRARLHRLRAELLADHLNDLPGAEHELRAALALRPFDVDILEDMVSLLTRVFEGKPPTKSIAIYLERLARANLVSRDAPSVDRGLSYLRRALEIDPENRDIWNLAERVLRSAGRWAELEEMYRSAIPRSDNAGKQAMLRKLVGLELFGRSGVARWACEQILTLDPTNTFARQRLRDLYEEANDHLARARLREEDIGRAKSARGQNAARLELAELYLRRFGDVDRACVLIGKVLTEDPYHAGAYDLAHLYLARQGHHPAYAEVLRHAVESPSWKENTEVQSPERVARAAELAWVLEALVKDPTQALSAWNRVLALAPGHAEARSAVARLETLLAESANELDELTQKAASLRKMSEKLAALRELGQKARKKDLDRAVHAYEELLEAKNNDEEALRVLEEIYTARRDFGGLVSTLRRRTSVVSSNEARAGLLNQIAAISHERLGAPDQALRICREVLRADPQNATALGRMERIYSQLGNNEGLLGVYSHKAQVTKENKERAKLYRDMAKLATEDMSRAASFWEQVRKENPGDKETHQALEELYTKLKRDTELAQILSARAARTPAGDPELPSILRRLARLYEKGASDPIRALETWEKLVEVAPEDLEALSAISAAREASGDIKAWVGIAKQLLAKYKDPARAAALAAKLAPVMAVDLENPEEANKLLATHVARIGVRGGDHARYLAKLREQQEDLRGALAALEVEFLSEETPQRKIALSQRIASIWRDGVKDPVQAIEAYRRLCQLDTRSEMGWRSLSDLYETLERFDDLVLARERLIALASEGNARAVLLQNLAKVHEHQRADQDGALACLRRACENLPDDEKTLRTFQEASARFALFTPLISHLDSLEISTPERVRKLAKVAEYCESNHQDVTRAIECWKATYERYPDEPSAFKGLSDLVEKTGRYESLVEAYEARLGHVDPPERSRLLQKIGELCEEKLGDPDRAVASFRRAFEAAPDDPQAVVGYAKALEERARWEEYIQLYERVALEAVDPAARGQALEKVAQVTRQQLGDLSRTFEVKRRAFDLDQADPTALRELETLAEESGEWEPLAEVYAALVERAGSDGVKLSRLDSLATLLEDKLQDDQAAYKRRLEAWRIDPRDIHLKQEAQRLAEKVSDFTPVIEILLDQAKETTHAEEESALLFEAGQLEENKQENEVRAFSLYLEAFLAEPKEEKSITELRRLAEEEPADNKTAENEAKEGEFQGPKRWGQILGAYERLLAESQDPKNRILYFQKIAQIFETPLEDDVKAFEILELALHVDRQETNILDEMERLGRREHLTERLLKRFEEEVERAQEAKEAVPYLERSARILDEVVEEPERSAEILRRILAMQPAHEGARTKLREIQRRLGRFDELITLLETEVAEAPPSQERRERMKEIASLYEDVLKNPREAQALYAKILVEEPTDSESLRHLTRLYESFGEWRKLAETEARLAPLEDDPEVSAERFRRVADIYETQLTLPRRAVEAYRSALGFVSNDLVSLRELSRLLEEQRRWEELVEVLERWETQVEEPDTIPIMVRRAKILAERLGKAQIAGEVLRKVLGQDPQNPEARRGLIETLHLEKNYTEIASLVAKWEAKGEVEPTLLARLGEAYVDEGNNEKAKEAFSRVLTSKPKFVEAIHGLAEIARREGEKEKATTLLSQEAQILQETENPSLETLQRSANLYDQIAGLYRDIGLLSRAREALRNSLAIDTKRANTMRQLLDIAQSVDDFDKVRASLQTLLERAEGREKAQLFAELGMVEWRGYSRAEASLEAFEESLTLTPGLPAAVAGIAEVHRERGTWTEDVTLQRLLLTLNEAMEQGLSRRDKAAGRLYYHYGHVKTRLGDLEEALTQLKRARERLGGDPEVNLGLAELCDEAGREEEAIRYYQSFTSHPEAIQRKERLAEAQLRLGTLLRKNGEPKQALESLILASDHEKTAPKVLPLAADTAEVLADPRTPALLKRQIEITDSPVARRELFARQAEAFALQGDHINACESLQSAIAEEVGVIPFSLYARLLDQLGDLERWDEALDIAKNISSLTESASPDDATVLNLRAAEVFSRTGETERASRHIEAALAADPSSEAAFEALERFHRGRKDFPALAKTYRRRLQTLSKDHEQYPQIQASLAQVLYQELDQADEAAKEAKEAYERLPENLSVLELASRAAEAAEAPLSERISLFSQFVEKEPANAEFLRKLGHCYEEKGDPLRSYWPRAVLHAFGVADQTETLFVTQRKRTNLRLAGKGGSLQVPELLLTPEFRKLGEVFAEVFLGAPSLFTAKSSEGTLLDPLEDSPVSRVWSDLVRLFPMLGLRAYRVPGKDVRPLRATPATVEIGEDVPKETSLLQFLLARAVVGARPPFVLFSTTTPEEGRRLYHAVLFAFDQSRRLSEASEEVATLVADLREQIPLRRKTRLATRLASFTEKGKLPTFEEFSLSLEASLNRVGLLYAGDLGAALRGIGGQNGEANLEARVKTRPVLSDLIRFAVSEEHLSLMKRFHITGPLIEGS